mmetsp:Transcript_55781/g.181141  ORF Transcript_55781/g.181141 Transcript_55781/m.181141 type:complete len:213 (-) Transcript_55781:371-1009(-)
MQEGPRAPHPISIHQHRVVLRVRNQRAAPVLHMHPDLVHPPGQDLDLTEREGGVVRPCEVSQSLHPGLCPLAPILVDERLVADPVVVELGRDGVHTVWRNVPIAQASVAFVDLAPLELRVDGQQSLPGLGAHEAAGSVAVQPVREASCTCEGAHATAGAVAGHVATTAGAAASVPSPPRLCHLVVVLRGDEKVQVLRVVRIHEGLPRSPVLV